MESFLPTNITHLIWLEALLSMICILVLNVKIKPKKRPLKKYNQKLQKVTDFLIQYIYQACLVLGRMEIQQTALEEISTVIPLDTIMEIQFVKKLI